MCVCVCVCVGKRDIRQKIKLIEGHYIACGRDERERERERGGGEGGGDRERGLVLTSSIFFS